MMRHFFSLLLITAFAVPALGSEFGNKPTDDGPAQIGIQIDLTEVLKNPDIAKALANSPGAPPFLKDLTNMQAYIGLPDAMIQDPSQINFHVKVGFKDAGAVTEAITELERSAPSIEEETVNGKKYKVVESPGGPTVYFRSEGKNLIFCTENFAKKSDMNMASDGLKKALKSMPANDVFKAAFDMKAAAKFLEDVKASVGGNPQFDPLFDASMIRMSSGGGQSDSLFMLAFDADNEDTANELKSTVGSLTSMAQIFGGAAAPDKEKMPASNEFFRHFMNSLKPEKDGNSIKIQVNKPANYAELEKKMRAEMKELGPGGVFGGGAGEEFKEDF